MNTPEQFDAELDAWVTQALNRMIAVFKTAAQYVIEDVRERTPYITGYLRNSWTVTLDEPLPMRGAQGDGYIAPGADLVINGAEIGDTIYATFVANYAVHVEYGTYAFEGRGMVRLAAQSWQAHVNKATADAKARIR